VAKPSSYRSWCSAILSGRFEICLEVTQHLHHTQAAIRSSHESRCATFFIGDFQVRIGITQQS